MSPKDMVLIARIRKPHGIKGEVVAEVFTDIPDRFQNLTTIDVRKKDGSIVKLEIESANEQNSSVRLKFNGYDDRDQAETLRDAELFIPEKERPTLPDGKVYFDEFIGMSVLDDRSGAKIGMVKDILEMPAGDVYVLDLNGVEHLLSSKSGEVISIDAQKKEVRVALLETY